MKKMLDPSESKLVGNWITVEGKIKNDATCDRIKWLISSYLNKIAISKDYGAWETLFQDPSDGRYWEQTFPQSEMHGGGPPQLESIDSEEAKKKYSYAFKNEE